MTSQISLYREEAQHSADTSEWYTPGWLLDAAREAIGSEFDLDPASCDIAQTQVRAKRFYTVVDDGLQQHWGGAIWCNPPTPPRDWWERMVDAFLDDRGMGVYLSYSIEPLSQSQLWRPERHMLTFPICIPRRRITFLSTAADALERLSRLIEKRKRTKGERATRAEQTKLLRLEAMNPDELVDGEAPTHASAIVGVGVDPERFRRAFEPIGAVKL